MKTYLMILGACIVAMILAATQWLAPSIGVAMGSAGFVVLILWTATVILRAAQRKRKNAAGLFSVGIFLLVIAYPSSRSVIGLFEPAVRSNYYTEVPAEVVFGVLGVVCIARAWWIWTSDEKPA